MQQSPPNDRSSCLAKAMVFADCDTPRPQSPSLCLANVALGPLVIALLSFCDFFLLRQLLFLLVLPSLLPLHLMPFVVLLAFQHLLQLLLDLLPFVGSPLHLGPRHSGLSVDT